VNGVAWRALTLLGGAALLLATIACGPAVERWEGELDDCGGNVDTLSGRRVLVYFAFPGGGDVDGWIGVADSAADDEALLFTEIERGQVDGYDIDFEADFGAYNADANLQREGDQIDGNVDVTYPIFFGTGSVECDLTLDPVR
jgi:hypothetical protein